MGRICWGSDGYGELLALRWCNVHFADSELIVEASWTAGQLTSPKSRKWRTVPLADQPAAALAGLAARERFAGPTTSCSAARSATTSIHPRCAGATARRVCARCASTTCGIS